MLVYGDHTERVNARARLLALAERMQGGPWSHDELTGHFVELAGVAQGLADSDFANAGCDRRRSAEATLLQHLNRLAERLLASWDAGCVGTSEPYRLEMPASLPFEIEIRIPEGYAFYALRPEAYALAARQLHLRGTPRVIGLRSIGTGLACAVSAALGVDPPITLRPHGDPFNRQLSISSELAADLLCGDPHFVVVDEGPGLSGSSFGCVADWLEERGVPRERIAFLAGHGNELGLQASARHRERWATVQRPVVRLDAPRPEWIEALAGSLTEPLLDISGGQWRPLWNAAEGEWPAINPTWERRKFLARTSSGTWLVKWAGLGAIGDSKLALARHLSDWSSELAGLTGGWLVTRWHEDALPTRPQMHELIDYLRLRASLPAPQPGASPETLVGMTCRNLPSFADWSPALEHIQPRPVCTDNRLAAHEWLRLPDGRLLKADVLDHHRAHDLIGCQDIAWEVAGAIIELQLAPEQAEQLRAALNVSPAMLRFYRVAYLAFHIGAHRMSAGSLEHWPAEQRRHLIAADRLEQQLPSVDAVEHAGHVH
ncbi:MAG TPA: hypothetical protein VM913_08945 [Sphingomicrobium sp.]|nr:hypothetical protein [Sphingomicrobium sp.]